MADVRQDQFTVHLGKLYADPKKPNPDFSPRLVRESLEQSIVDAFTKVANRLSISMNYGGIGDKYDVSVDRTVEWTEPHYRPKLVRKSPFASKTTIALRGDGNYELSPIIGGYAIDVLGFAQGSANGLSLEEALNIAEKVAKIDIALLDQKNVFEIGTQGTLRDAKSKIPDAAREKIKGLLPTMSPDVYAILVTYFKPAETTAGAPRS